MKKLEYYLKHQFSNCDSPEEILEMKEKMSKLLNKIANEESDKLDDLGCMTQFKLKLY